MLLEEWDCDGYLVQGLVCGSAVEVRGGVEGKAVRRVSMREFWII
jgi:hypothetical protein